MNKKWVIIIGTSLLAAGILFWWVGRYDSLDSMEEEPVSLTHVPDFLLYDLENQPVRLSDFQGKLLLINFWATWCPPCMEEIPHLEKLFQNYAKKGLMVLGISVDEAGREHVQRFIKKNGISYPIAMSQKKLEKDFGGIRGIPTSFLIDRSGKIVKKWVGYRDYSFFESLIKEQL